MFEFVELGFEAELAGSRRTLPPFTGATLRGAFGWLLKQTVCQVSHGNCERCLLKAACPYPAVFEGLPPAERDIMRKYPRIPQPFVILTDPVTPETEQADCGTLRWGVRLFGPATRFWPYVVHTFQTAGEQGLGQRRTKFKLTSVTDGIGGKLIGSGDAEVWGEPQLRPADGSRTAPEVCTLRWRFLTPLQIVRGGRQTGTDLDGLDLLLAGRRRSEIMRAFYATSDDVQSSEGAARPASVRLEREDFTTLENSLQRWDLQRYSGRQERKMELRGVIGDLVIQGPWGRADGGLQLIETLHLGKSTSFGFGAVRWEIV